jgi:hypothetical protein
LGKIELRRQEDMKMLVALVALLALVGSAMAWDIDEQLTYTFSKSAFEQGGYLDVLPQIVGTQTGAYVKEPSAYCPPSDPCTLWGQVDNKLVAVTIDRLDDEGLNNPSMRSIEGQNFYAKLTQGGSASMSTSCKDTISTDPEISGSATAYQNLWVGGEFAETDATFDSRAIAGFVPSLANPTANVVITDTTAATATVDADKYGAGYFNTADMGVQVEADIEQNYVGSGWAEPKYSGGITMWAEFDGACDPGCANPIITKVSGEAHTSLFPADLNGGSVSDGSSYYWNGFQAKDVGW